MRATVGDVGGTAGQAAVARSRRLGDDHSERVAHGTDGRSIVIAQSLPRIHRDPLSAQSGQSERLLPTRS
jgi:hypothetical protein